MGFIEDLVALHKPRLWAALENSEIQKHNHVNKTRLYKYSRSLSNSVTTSPTNLTSSNRRSTAKFHTGRAIQARNVPARLLNDKKNRNYQHMEWMRMVGRRTGVWPSAYHNAGFYPYTHCDTAPRARQRRQYIPGCVFFYT